MSHLRGVEPYVLGAFKSRVGENGDDEAELVGERGGECERYKPVSVYGSGDSVRDTS
jgi:hypothetical protein